MYAPSQVPNVPTSFEPFGRWFERTFKLYGDKLGVWILQGLIFIGLYLGIILVPLIALFASMGLFSSMRGHSLDSWPSMLTVPLIGGAVLILLIAVMVLTYLQAGITYTALKQCRGEQIAVSDIFKAGYAFLPILGANLLMGLAILVALVFCILPALFVPAFFLFTMPMIIDQRLGVVESIRKSIDIVKQNYWLFFLYGLVFMALSFAVNMASNIPFLGVLISIALMIVSPVIGALYVAVPYVEMTHGPRTPGGAMAFQTPGGPQAYIPPAYTPTNDITGEMIPPPPPPPSGPKPE